jgi:hypothetical protein
MLRSALIAASTSSSSLIVMPSNIAGAPRAISPLRISSAERPREQQIREE